MGDYLKEQGNTSICTPPQESARLWVRSPVTTKFAGPCYYGASRNPHFRHLPNMSKASLTWSHPAQDKFIHRPCLHCITQFCHLTVPSCHTKAPALQDSRSCTSFLLHPSTQIPHPFLEDNQALLNSLPSVHQVSLSPQSLVHLQLFSLCQL